jgi:hypothetical protein
MPGGAVAALKTPQTFDGISRAIFDDPRGHAVQFYAEDESLLHALSHFIGGALVDGHTAIVVATSEHRERLAQVLQEHGLDPMVVVEQGRYLVLDAAECLYPPT